HTRFDCDWSSDVCSSDLWHHKYCYLAAPLLRAGAERAVLRRWLDWLGARAALVRLEDAPGDGPVHLALVDELNRRGWPSLVTQRSEERRVGKEGRIEGNA